MTNIAQEILDWWNDTDQLDEDDKESDYTSYIWTEFHEHLTFKEWADKHGLKAPLLESGPAYLVEDHGGGEGDGEERWVVFSVGDKLYRVDGYYASWDGSNWDNPEPYEVEPVQVQVTRYQRKK